MNINKNHELDNTPKDHTDSLSNELSKLVLYIIYTFLFILGSCIGCIGFLYGLFVLMYKLIIK